MNLSKTRKISTISNKNDIRYILNTGQKIYTKFGLIFIKNDDIVSGLKTAVLLKKTVGNAVKRNYIKRIIKYFFVKNFKLFKKNNLTIFLYNYHGSIRYKDLENEYINALKKL